MKVPFLDLKVQYESIREEIAPALQAVLDRTAFAGGPFVEQFEREFAAFCQTPDAVGVDSGTTALWVALLGLGVGPGDEVITAPNSFIATAEAISFTGATPVFVDTREACYTLDPEKIEAAITPKTKAIIPVHLYGQCADMDPILEIAKKHKLYVIEDAAQAQGSLYKGRPAGSMGDAGCFSFYPGKNLGAYGEAGAVTTSNEALAATMRRFRDHGQAKKYYHSMIGWNARMDGFQGAVLSVKLKHLPKWNDARRRHAAHYIESLSGVPGLTLPREMDYAKHIWHIFPVRTARREEFMAAVSDAGVACGIHYPVPIHLQEAYAGLGLSEGAFPVAEKCAAEQVSLPMFPDLSDEQVGYVCEQVRRYCETASCASA